MTPELLAELHAHREHLEYQADQLREIANAFERTGNATMSRELWHMAHTISNQARGLDAGIGRELDRMSAVTRESAANTLKFALAQVAKDVPDAP